MPAMKIRSWIAALALLALAPAARAGREKADLQRDIDAQRAAVADFERLDEKRAVTDEITLLRTWLDEASAQFAKEEWDKVREVLDRCVAQAELLRQKIAATKLGAQAQGREAAVKASRDKIEKTRAALQQALVTKKAMEMNNK
jgi:hypothetical protein